MDLCRHGRSWIAQFRRGILPLHVETGWLRNVLLFNRTSFVWNIGAVENVFNFLCECDTSQDYRLELYQNISIIYWTLYSFGIFWQIYV